MDTYTHTHLSVCVCGAHICSANYNSQIFLSKGFSLVKIYTLLIYNNLKSQLDVRILHDLKQNFQ